MNDSERLKENSRLRLANIGLPIARIASINGMSRAKLSLWLNVDNPVLHTLGKLAEVLGIPTFELLNPDFDPRKYPNPYEGEETSKAS